MQKQAPIGTAIITGAASGMGEAAAQLMAAAGWKLLLTDLNAERLEQAAQRLRAPNQGQDKGRVETLAGDISAPDYTARLLAAVGDAPIGALIHCAGLSPTMAEPDRILEVNLAATMRLLDGLRAHFAAGAAAVIFSSSSAYMVGTHFDAQILAVTSPDQVASLVAISSNSGMAYSISKRAVQLLVRREASRFGAYGARIVSVSPGIIDTPMGRAEMVSHPIMQQLVDNSPLKRAAAAEEVAAVAVFICSPAASFVTGIDILVDGGAMAADAVRE